MDVSHPVREKKITKENAKTSFPNYFPIPEALVVNLWVFTAMDWCFGCGPHNDAIIICIIGINFSI